MSTLGPWVKRVFLATVLGSGLAGKISATPATAPVLQVDYPFPTADKPQSKLWFSQGHWWALLPRADGPSLWQRTATGWTEHAEIHAALRGVPGRADVWSDRDGVTAVSVADRMMAVFRLLPTGAPSPGWHAELLARLPAPATDSIETATLARDAAGVWWVAAVVQGKAYAWSSADARSWSAPENLAKGLDPDDICAVAPLADGVAVIWSNQKKEEVMLRRHRTGRPVTEWEPAEPVQRGDATADDHLHAVLAADGTLWVATKNSVDREGAPQFVLRVRSPDGAWRNLPYGILVPGQEISRPVVVLAGAPQAVYAGHSLFEPPGRSAILFGRVDLAHPEVVTGLAPVIVPEVGAHTRVNDITASKAPMPRDGPWIVLASDGQGRVYEADLRPAPAKP